MINETITITIGPHTFTLADFKSWDYLRFEKKMQTVFGDKPGFDFQHAWALVQEKLKSTGIKDLMIKHKRKKQSQQRDQKLKIGMKLTHRS